MLISHSHRFIYFHVAKTAGLSIREALTPYTVLPDKFKIRRPPEVVAGKPNPLYLMWENTVLHAKAVDVKKELSSELYDSYYKFAFVRNPWDWQVSMYHFILKEFDHVSHTRVRSMKNFEEYLEWVVRTPRPFARGATKFQKDVLTGKNGGLLVDFVGRFERLEQDFIRICREISINATLPKINATVHKDYRSYYNQKTKRIVEEHFREDIELFGYVFN
ncbi:MAG: sulfotransferase [Candidatus Electrothrix sp. GM3_4]|nr:sulfotransferase [Candidatus Electrothrix sp. GM3_4]